MAEIESSWKVLDCGQTWSWFLSPPSSSSFRGRWKEETRESVRERERERERERNIAWQKAW